MDSTSPLELISFKVCPFVQRSAIILNEKNVKYNTTYIDLNNLPDWFADVSPLGKVPVLRVQDAVVFESAVIAEYIEECYAPSLHPSDPLEKANHRSWTEFASDITMNMFAMLYEKDGKKFSNLKDKVAEQFSQLEKSINIDGPYFSGKDFHLVDAAYAPIFSRIQLVEQVYPLNLFTKRIAHWSEIILQRKSVKNAVVDDFDTLFMQYINSTDGYLSSQIITPS